MSHYDKDHRPVLLSIGDQVDFAILDEEGDPLTLSYLVNDDFLANRGRSGNEEIFVHLHLDKFAEARSAYGYESHGGDWPTFNENDLEAATRLVNRLYEVLTGSAVAPVGPRPVVIDDSRSKLNLVERVKSSLHRILYDLKNMSGRPFQVASLRSLDQYAVEKALPVLVSMGVLVQEGHIFKGGSFLNELTYLDCKNRGEGVDVLIPRNDVTKARVIKYIMEQPHSVTKDELFTLFGRDSWLDRFVDEMAGNGMLKAWRQGYYVKRTGREAALALIAAGGLEAPVIPAAPAQS